MKRLYLVFAFVLSLVSASFGAVDLRQAINQLALSGEYEQATQLLNAVNIGKWDRLLLEADIAIAQGNYGKAIANYRALVAQFPDNPSIRVELVKLLIANKNQDSAIFHLNELALQTDNLEQKNVYTQEIAKLSDYQKFGASGSFGLTPSTNVNNASDQETISLPNIFGEPGSEIVYQQPDELLPQFGWRMNAGLSAFGKARIADNQELVLRGNISTTMYTVPTLDQKSAELSLSWNYQSARTSLSVTPFIRRDLGDGEAYDVSPFLASATIVSRDEDSWNKGVRIYGERYFKYSRSLFLSGEASTTVYDDQEGLGYADSKYNSLRLGYSFMANPRNRVSIWVGAAGLAQKGSDNGIQTDGAYKHWSSYDSKSLGFSVDTVFASGVRTKFTLQHSKKDFLGEPPLERPNVAREDDVSIIGLEFSNQNWTIGSFLPKLDCQYSITNSNYDDYSTNGSSCGLSITQSF